MKEKLKSIDAEQVLFALLFIAGFFLSLAIIAWGMTEGTLVNELVFGSMGVTPLTCAKFAIFFVVVLALAGTATGTIAALLYSIYEGARFFLEEKKGDGSGKGSSEAQ